MLFLYSIEKIKKAQDIPRAIGAKLRRALAVFASATTTGNSQKSLALSTIAGKQ